ncbi:MAG: glycosyltransferase family 2 protein, partial [Smithellaceae bacterium]
METGTLTEAPASPVEISVVLPAFQEEQGIAPLLDRIRGVMEPLGRPWEVIVVDDGSTDGTAERAREKGARVVSHPYNIGNGAAVKTGIREARGRVIVMMDADGQHDPADIPRLLEHVGTHDMV